MEYLAGHSKALQTCAFTIIYFSNPISTSLFINSVRLIQCPYTTLPVSVITTCKWCHDHVTRFVDCMVKADSVSEQSARKRTRWPVSRTKSAVSTLLRLPAPPNGKLMNALNLSSRRSSNVTGLLAESTTFGGGIHAVDLCGEMGWGTERKGEELQWTVSDVAWWMTCPLHVVAVKQKPNVHGCMQLQN